jgi:hypothetical protein
VNNKKKNILVWIFVWAGLLIAVLYSPIGSPDLYSTKGYFVGNQSVNFKDGAIENAPKGGVFTDEDNNNQINVPDYSSSENNSPKYAVNSSATANTSGSTTSGSYNASQPSAYQNTSGSSSSGSMGGGGSTFISRNSSKSSDASSTITMNSGGVTTLSTNLSTTSPKQSTLSGATGSGNSGTDPGGDPTGPPVPVGDGWIFLLLLAAGYGAWRKKFRQVTKTQIEK